METDKAIEFWLDQETYWSKAKKEYTEKTFGHDYSDCIHVIEYTAYEQLGQKVKELEKYVARCDENNCFKLTERLQAAEDKIKAQEKMLIVEIKSHLPIYAPEYVAKEMLKDRIKELEQLTKEEK